MPGAQAEVQIPDPSGGSVRYSFGFTKTPVANETVTEGHFG